MTEPMQSAKLYVLVNGAQQPEVLEIPPGSTMDDVRSLFFSVADVSYTDKDAVAKLTRADGTVLPLSANLPVNSAKDPYHLSVKSTRTTAINAKQSLIESKLLEITKTLEAFQEFGSLKENLANFQKQIQETSKQISAGTYPVTGNHVPKMAVKRLTKIDPRFTSQPKYVFTEETIAYLKLPSFNNWQWEENEMAALLEHMFFELGLVEHFKIELAVLKRFLNMVKDNYNLNPFHNFRHCFCVTQMMYGILHCTGLHAKLDPIDKMILMISCICHDLDHPGYNNAYQINARTELAIIYNDQSPLENHHCAVAFTILKNPETNIIANATSKEWTEIRKGVIRCILGTDMAKHGEIVNKFKTVVDTFSLADSDHRSQLLVLIMKCADISNEARPNEVAEPWVDCLLEEFFAQSDREKAEGLPVAPFMDREKVTKPGAQVGFIGFVMIPLFELVAKVFPEIETQILPQIRKSHVYYKEMGEKLATEKK